MTKKHVVCFSAPKLKGTGIDGYLVGKMTTLR